MPLATDSPSPTFRRLRRAVLWAVGTMIVLIGGFTVWMAVHEYRLSLHSADLQTRGYVSALKEHAERTLSETDAALRYLIEKLPPPQQLSQVSGQALEAILRRHLQNSPQISTAVLINAQGVLFARSEPEAFRPISVSERDYFIYHRDHPADDGLFISQPFKSQLSGRWIIILSRVLRDGENHFNGVAAMALDLDYFQSFYARLALGTMGKIVLIRRDGVLLLAHPANDADYSADFKKSFVINTYLPKAESGTFHIPGGQALIHPGGRIISYAALQGFPVVATANMGIEEVTSEWHEHTRFQALLSLFFVLVIGYFSWLLLRQLRRLDQAHLLRIQQQAALKTAADAWEATFNAVADSIWIMDLDRRILRANAAAMRTFSDADNAIIGQNCGALTQHQHLPDEICPFHTMMKTGERATKMINIGAHWYEVSVDPMRNEAGEIVGVVHIASDVTSIKSGEEQARESEALLRALLAAIPDAIYFRDAAGRGVLANPAGLELFGIRAEDYQGKTMPEMAENFPRYQDVFHQCYVSDEKTWHEGKPCHFQETVPAEDGSRKIFAITKVPLYHDDASRLGMVVIGRDMTRDQQLEEQLRQVQKMEAIGHLAGGIAHDFNNLLSPILGYAKMIAADLKIEDPLYAKISHISTAVRKAKDLTQQLMNFSRRQPQQLRVLNLNQVIDTFYPILCRTIRENLALTLELDASGVFIEAQQSQIEQILLNLAINAQDAITHKGEIIIETQRFVLGDNQLPPCAEMSPGAYACLKFRDTGCGMDSETLAHIFEPFYTNKEEGLGTGLGLTTVYTIVQTCGGTLRVNSQPQKGTTFEIYFPLVSEPPPAKPQPVNLLHKTGDGQSILLAEDDDMVRRMVHEMLTMAGYQVQDAVDGSAALRLARSADSSYDLLVSDVVMPGLDGPELYAELLAFMPDLKVLFISGYATNPNSRGRVAKIDPEIFLQKPFSAQDLLARVQEILESPDADD